MIKVSKSSKEELEILDVKKWHPWECDPSSFDWSYMDNETCYILEGQAKVHTDKGTVEFGQGDLVVFPAGLKCKWDVLEKIKKVYKMD